MTTYKKTVHDLERRFKVAEIFISTLNAHRYHVTKELIPSLLEVGTYFEYYGTVLGHTLLLGIFRHISGAATYDVESGEDNFQFSQANFLRTCVFAARCLYRSDQKINYRYEIPGIPETYFCQTIHCYSIADIIKAIDDNHAFRRPLSAAANKRGLYTLEDRKRVAPEWFDKHPHEESVILAKEKYVKTKMLIITDTPKKIISAPELLMDAELCDSLERIYPDLELILKFTGIESPFIRKGFDAKKSEDGKLIIASGEGYFNFHADEMIRALVQLKEQGLF